MPDSIRGVPEAVLGYFGSEGGKRLAIALAVAAVLIIALRLVRFLVFSAVRRRGTSQATILAEKIFQYLGFSAIVLIALDIAGVNASALLGAAGIAGIALGFAAQTSVSNVISGLFLITEKAFVVGDVIRAGDVTGTVKSIDILSVKLITFDNQLVRIPNETLVKSVIVNITRHPVRRLNIRLLVPHGSPLRTVRDALEETSGSIPLVMAEPAPFFFVDSWDQEGVWILYGVWIEHADVVEVKNEFYFRVQESFERRGIRPPMRSVFLSETEPHSPKAPRSANAPER